MLNKRQRLNNYVAFIATYRQKKIVSDENLILYGGRVKEDDKDYPTRVGFVVSKKIHKRAVRRNKIKRLLRNSYQSLYKKGEIGAAGRFQSLIFVARQGALEKNYEEMFSSVKNLLQKLANNFL